MEGYVYILVNSSLPNLVKIGRTTKTPNARAAELSSTGTPGRFIVAYSVLVNDCVEVESMMHSIFSDQRHTNDREFFDLDAPTAIDKLNEISKDRKLNGTTQVTQGGQGGGMAVLYLAKITNFANVHRIGLLKKPQSFLSTNDFREMLVELYQSWDSNIMLGDIEILELREFEGLSDEAIHSMQNLIDANLVNTKKNHSSLFFNRKYDERTLDYKIMQEPTPKSVFKSTLSLVEPIAKASQQKAINAVYEDENKAKLQKIQKYRSLGI